MKGCAGFYIYEIEKKKHLFYMQKITYVFIADSSCYFCFDHRFLNYACIYLFSCSIYFGFLCS